MPSMWLPRTFLDDLLLCRRRCLRRWCLRWWEKLSERSLWTKPLSSSNCLRAKTGHSQHLEFWVFLYKKDFRQFQIRNGGLPFEHWCKNCSLKNWNSGENLLKPKIQQIFWKPLNQISWEKGINPSIILQIDKKLPNYITKPNMFTFLSKELNNKTHLFFSHSYSIVLGFGPGQPLKGMRLVLCSSFVSNNSKFQLNRIFTWLVSFANRWPMRSFIFLYI